MSEGLPGPEPIRSRVLGELDDPRVRFAFPSEVAARGWLERALELSGRRALPAGRFASWDAFKSARFPGPPGERPCPKLVRSLFSRALMAENASAPFLRSLVPPARADASPRFARSVASALPSLRDIPAGPGDGLADWREIRRRYADFLRSRGLYEASWNPRAAAPGPDRWILFYPDLTEDWADYEAAVRALPDAVVVDSASLPPEPVPAATFATLVDEVRAALLSMRRDMEAGTAPGDIAISVAAPDSALPVLEREAAVAGVPLDARDARPLSGSAGGRLLADLLDFSKSGRSFEAVRRLCLDLSRPWKDPLTARSLVDLGIRKHVLAPLPDRWRDIWEASMDETTPPSLRAMYRGMSAAADRLSSAAGFAAVREAYDGFRRAWLDDALWSPAQDDEVARCLAELDALEDAATLAGLPVTGGAAAAWLEHLADVRYLPVSPGGGVAVYRFPVAAGASPRAHYLLNLAEGAAVSASRPLAFLRDDERDLAGARDRDLSPGLVRLLGMSGGTVRASWSEDGPDGVRPAHPAVSPRPAAELGAAWPPEAWLPARDELGTAGQGPVFPVQKAGAAAACVTVRLPPGPSLSGGTPDRPSTLDPELTAAMLASLSSRHGGKLALSDTLVEHYRSCAFRWLFTDLFKVEEVPTGLSFIDARMLGTIYHEALAGLLRPLRDEAIRISACAGAGEPTRPARADLERALDAAIHRASREHGPFAGEMIRCARPALLRHLSGAADCLRSILDGCTPALVEEYLEVALGSTPDAILVGKADLVCVPPDGAGSAVIVDYKKKKLPARKELRPDDGGRLEKLQMHAYAALVESAGLTAVRAWYLPIEADSEGKRSPLEAFGPGDRAAVPPGGLAALRECLEEACRSTAAGLGAGWIFVPRKADQENTCKECTMRPVCRERYAVP